VKRTVFAQKIMPFVSVSRYYTTCLTVGETGLFYGKKTVNFGGEKHLETDSPVLVGGTRVAHSLQCETSSFAQKIMPFQPNFVSVSRCCTTCLKVWKTVHFPVKRR
jgi:hypothetical protein